MESQINRALGYGIPIDRLEGMPDFLKQVIKNNPEIQYIVVMNKKDDLLFSQGEASAMVFKTG